MTRSPPPMGGGDVVAAVSPNAAGVTPNASTVSQDAVTVHLTERQGVAMTIPRQNDQPGHHDNVTNVDAAPQTPRQRHRCCGAAARLAWTQRRQSRRSPLRIVGGSRHDPGEPCNGQDAKPCPPSHHERLMSRRQKAVLSLAWHGWRRTARGQ